MKFVRSYILYHSLFFFVPLIHSMHVQPPLSPLQKALLEQEIESRGVHAVRNALKAPALLYDNERGLSGIDDALLRIEAVFHKKDVQTSLSCMVFEAIRQAKTDGYYYNARSNSGYLDDVGTYYEWNRPEESDNPTVTVHMHIENRQAIEEVLNAHTVNDGQ